MTLKTLIFTLAAAVALIPSTAVAQNFVGGPGIAISGSATQEQLPARARQFLGKFYKDVPQTSIERDFDDNVYEVDLANGVEIHFGPAGQVIGIEADDLSATLSPQVVKALLPEKAYKDLQMSNLEDMVDEIEFRKGKLVELSMRNVNETKYSYDITEATWQLL